MSVLLHLSDPHFGTEQAPVVAALQALATVLKPECAVLSGDITQRARRSQFVAARAFADRLPAPLLAVPGNHDLPLFDLWTRWRAPYRYYKEAFGPDLEPVWSSIDWRVIGVNATRPRRHKDGEVSPAQVARVAELLRQATPTQICVVVVHQPMLAVEASDLSNLLHGRAAAAAAWSAAGADLVLGGHIHLPYVRPMREAQPAIPRQLWVVQAGTAVSTRVRAGTPNSVNAIERLDARTCAVVRWDYDARHDAFVEVSRRVLALDPR